MIGLNTRADRESTPGYVDNFVRCKCSESKEKKLVNDLTDFDATNIKFGMQRPAIQDYCTMTIIIVNITIQVFK